GLTKRWSERPPVLRSPFAWLKPFHCERRSLPVAVAHLVLVRSYAPRLLQDSAGLRGSRRVCRAAICPRHDHLAVGSDVFWTPRVRFRSQRVYSRWASRAMVVG